MRFLSRVTSNQNLWPLAIVLVFALLAGRYLLLPGYFPMHDDLHTLRQLEMEKCIIDLQIPCRWVPDMAFGLGYPLFNYRPPLPYLFGEMIRLLGFSFINTAKIGFLLSIIISGIGMYLLAKEFFGIWGGILSSVFYIWAPYHALDIYVRGNLNEAWALSWFPLILWTAERLVTEKKKILKWIIGSSLSWCALLLTHNQMVLLLIPFYLVWCFILLTQYTAWRKIANLILSGLLALGLAAFFFLPALFEQRYIHIDTMISGYYEYTAHFASISQLLFSRFWGYGISEPGIHDQMSFQVGQFYWVMSLLITGPILYKLHCIKYKDNKDTFPYLPVVFSFLAGWVSIFMTHPRSLFIWQMFDFLKYFQFPWRFLSISILALSFFVGSLAILLPMKTNKIFIPVLTIFLVSFNWNYFKPEKMEPLTDSQKLSGVAYVNQMTDGIYDFLPIDAISAPTHFQESLVEVISGNGIITNVMQGSNWATFQAVISSPSAQVRLGIIKFPNWKIAVDRELVKAQVPKGEKWGRMYFTIPTGEHDINIRLYNTPIRSIANIISLMSWISIFFFFLFRKSTVCLNKL